MTDTGKYLIHATIAADGVVERSDVVGAVFGQTEGLLGDELDLRELQDSSKVGRIDVRVDSENGRSLGEITIASSLDRVETAILAAGLETITRVGPCEAYVEVERIEDVRAAKRREVVERAKELLAESFDEDVLDSRELVEEVRESVRVADLTEYRGLPAGPRVADSDAVVVVEGRADVLTLLRYGVKNAVAVEGTDVPEAVADLTAGRTVTAFLDGDRGGELILRELAQVGDVDYVAFAPTGRSVEDLARHEVFAALRDKTPFDDLPAEDPRAPFRAGDDAGPGADGGTDDADGDGGAPGTTPGEEAEDGTAAETEIEDGTAADAGVDDGTTTGEGTDGGDGAGADTPRTASTDGAGVGATPAPDDPPTAPDATPSPDAGAGTPSDATDGPADGSPGSEAATTDTEAANTADTEAATTADADTKGAGAPDAGDDADAEVGTDADAGGPDAPPTLREHVAAVVGEGSGEARLLDGDLATVATVPAEEAFDAVEAADATPYAVVLDGTLDQRLLDVAAQRGVEHLVARSTGEFVKQPVGVRVRTADRVAG